MKDGSAISRLWRCAAVLVVLVGVNGCAGFGLKGDRPGFQFTTGVRQQDLDAWVGMPVEALDMHSLFNTIPVTSRVTKYGVEIRNYKNGPCNNIFYIQNEIVLEYAPTGRCYTDEMVLPSNRYQARAVPSPTIPKPSPTPKPSPPTNSVSTGSGFFGSKLGHVITNEHVVSDCGKVTVGDNAKKQVTADVLETDRRNDLALLKISSTKMASADTKFLISKLGITVVPLASDGLLRSEDVKLGERVLVAGYPYGEIFSNTIKVTGGMVSANRGFGDDTGQFQIDAAVQPGSSGGPNL